MLKKQIKKKLSEEEIKILKRQRRQLKIMGTIHDINEITDTLGEQNDQFRSLIKSATIFMNPLTAVFGILGTIGSVFEIESRILKIDKELKDNSVLY